MQASVSSKQHADGLTETGTPSAIAGESETQAADPQK